MKVRMALAITLEIFAWTLAVWILTAPAGEPLVPRAWLHTSGMCRYLAWRFGVWGILAERNYWKAIRA